MHGPQNLPRRTNASHGRGRAILVLALAAIPCLSGPAFADEAPGKDPGFPKMSLDQDPKPEAPPAKDAEAKLPWRSFEFEFGGTYSSVTSSVILSNTDRGRALSIDGEGVLGLSSEMLSPYVWTAFRLGERHRISFSFEDMTRSASHTLERDITINGTTFTVGRSAHSEMGLQTFTLTYIWSFLQDERMELGLTLGVTLLRTHMEVDVSSPETTTNERINFPIPLPGANADFVLIKNLWLRERLELMYVPIQSYSGLFIDFNTALEWSFIDNLSIGLGFDLKRIDLESTENSTTLGSFDGKFKFNTAGVLFYLNFHM